MKTSKNYKKLFADFWGYHESDIPICWGCYKQQAVDIHHLIQKGMGGVKNNRLNRIDNLFPLCRSCHNHAHSNKAINEVWKEKLKEKIYHKEWGYLYEKKI
jgi:5-methylcytosine-specific restriction endonuclease McrA